jgi:hypothetical protein
VGKTEIKDYSTTQLKVPITRGLVNSFVLRHSDQFFKTKRTAQEQQRLQVPRMFLERTEQSRIWKNTFRSVWLNWCSIYAKLAFPIGKIARRRRLSSRRRCVVRRYIMKYLEPWNIFRWFLASLLPESHLLLI